MSEKRGAPTKTSGHDDYLHTVHKSLAFMGNFFGVCIFTIVSLVITVELILNPIFMYAQIRHLGVNVGTPFHSWVWFAMVYIIIATTVITTGLQYSLLERGTGERKFRLYTRRGDVKEKTPFGRKLGFVFLGIDTAMDGGGISAWYDSWQRVHNLNPLQGDASHLTLGIFPAGGLHAGWFVWLLYGVTCAACMLHEPILDEALSKITDVIPPGAAQGTINLGLWIDRTAKLHDKTKAWTIAATPFLMMFMDVALFPISVGHKGPIAVGFFFGLTFAITTWGILSWEFYRHLRRHGWGLGRMNLTQQVVVISGFVANIIDSAGDLSGVNQCLFGTAAPWPVHGVITAAAVPTLLTLALIMIICTFDEMFVSDILTPIGELAAVAVKIMPGYGASAPMPAMPGATTVIEETAAFEPPASTAPVTPPPTWPKMDRHED